MKSVAIHAITIYVPSLEGGSNPSRFAREAVTVQRTPTVDKVVTLRRCVNMYGSVELKISALMVFLIN